MEKSFEVTGISTNLRLKETGLSYDQKFVCSDSSGQNIWNKKEKSDKLNKTCRFQLVNATLNMRATQNKGQIWGVLES